MKGDDKQNGAKEYDLHAHTTASDGTYSPSELVRLAHRNGLAGIGITDHDTLQGIADAQEEARKLQIQIVPGVELNTEYKGREVHVLGYYVDEQDESFLQLCSRLREGRVNRAEKMIQKLYEHGIQITMEDVLHYAKGDAIGRPHVARTLVEKGYCKSIQEAFERFLIPGRPGYVERMKLHPVEAVKAILTAKGCPVLAHPGLIGDDELIEELVQHGLKGLEVSHPDHTPEQRDTYRAIAERFQLITTGGSDFHGQGAEHRGDLGTVRVTEAVVQALYQAAKHK
jgi:3',5'-nucleoside bisphosphate phosphatase